MAKKPPDKRNTVIRPPSSSGDDDDPDRYDQIDNALDAAERERETPLERHGAGASSSSAELADTQRMDYPKPCKCTKDPCPCYCHVVPDSVRAIAFQRPHTPRAPEQILRVRHAGAVINVPVCWTAEEVAAAHAKHRDGVVDLLRVRQPGYQSLGTPAELEWLAKRAAELAKK